MRRLFKSYDTGEVVNEVQHSFEVLKSKPGTKIYVGCDSQNKGRKTYFALVIAYRYDARGVHFVYSKWHEKKLKKEVRLKKETEITMGLVNRLAENSVPIHVVEFDLNGNPNHFSNKYVNEATGWAGGLGFRTTIKPDEQVAVKAANHLCQR